MWMWTLCNGGAPIMQIYLFGHLSSRSCWQSNHLLLQKGRFFSLKAAFDTQQEHTLQDYIETSVMLQYNQR